MKLDNSPPQRSKRFSEPRRHNGAGRRPHQRVQGPRRRPLHPQVPLRRGDGVCEALLGESEAPSLAYHDPRRVYDLPQQSGDMVARATEKLKKKHLDLIVVNDITAKDSGFDTDTTRVTFIGRDGKAEQLPLMLKSEVAHKILDRVVALLAH